MLTPPDKDQEYQLSRRCLSVRRSLAGHVPGETLCHGAAMYDALQGVVPSYRLMTTSGAASCTVVLLHSRFGLEQYVVAPQQCTVKYCLFKSDPIPGPVSRRGWRVIAPGVM